jgi:hypothetical protein
MADFREGVLWRYEPETGALQRISSPGEPRHLAVVGEDVYVASDGPELFSGNISRHDSRTGQREAALTLLACAVGSGDDVLWAAGCPFVQRLNTDGGPLKELATVLVPYADPLRDTPVQQDRHARPCAGRQLRPPPPPPHRADAPITKTPPMM